MGRKNVYLGTRVKDVPPKGLSSLSEVRGIAREIARDYKSGRIDRAKAQRRFNLLKLAIARDSDFRGIKKQKALNIVERIRNKLFQPKRGRSKKRSKKKKKGRRK